MDDYISRYTITNTLSYEKLGNFFSNNEENERIMLPDKILDIGCSFGISSEYLKQHFTESMITGVDLSPYFLAIASFRNNRTSNDIQYVHANAEDMPFDSNTYDKIFIQYLFHEMPESAIQNVVKETFRLLKPGGILAIVDLEPKNLNEKLSINIFRKWAFEVTEPHIFAYYKTNLTSLLDSFGFRNIESKKNDPINTIILAQK